MRQIKPKKLAIAGETIRQLGVKQLTGVVGGETPRQTNEWGVCPTLVCSTFPSCIGYTDDCPVIEE